MEPQNLQSENFALRYQLSAFSAQASVLCPPISGFGLRPMLVIREANGAEFLWGHLLACL
jgi:hypothetical protein